MNKPSLTTKSDSKKSKQKTETKQVNIIYLDNFEIIENQIEQQKEQVNKDNDENS